MKTLRTVLLAAALAAGALAAPAQAAATDPLFINLTTDDKHRVEMGIGFGKGQLALGHPLTIFLNDRAVQIASAAFAPKFEWQQKHLKAAIEQGANVLICSACMAHFGVQEADLLPGVKVSNTALSGAALFREHTRTLSW
jgi:sulfur relay (sulfurtransferase) complex TusBCD TusD component (DsrE family)